MRSARATVLVVLSALAAVYAQHDEPSGPTVEVSDGCQRFLDALDVNPKLDACLKSVTSATAAFNSTESDAEATHDQIVAAFDGMCSSTACKRDDVVDLLTQFAGACSDELVAVQDVSSTYDLLYNMLPMRETLCTKDGASYCALKKDIVGSASSLELPEDDLAQIVMANLDALGTGNMPFLFMKPDSPVTALCSTCFQDILANLVAYQDAIAYQIGTAQSPLLQGLPSLWQAVVTNCSPEVAQNVAVKGGASEDPEQVEGQGNGAATHAVPAALAALLAGVAAFVL